MLSISSKMSLSLGRGSGFTPQSLLAGATDFVWLDPSAAATRWQDSGATTPAAADGDPIALLQDRSGNGNHLTLTNATYRTSGGLHWIAFNGTSTTGVTPTLTPGTNKGQIFAAVTKNSDAARQMIAELGNNATGGLLLDCAVPGSPVLRYRALVVGSGGNPGDTTISATFDAPDTAVIAALSDLATGTVAAQISLRVNGADQIDPVGVASATINHLDAPLYVGARNGSSLFFGGALFGLIARFGPNLSSGQVASTEQWLRTKAGVTF